jgi:uncharacterized membrane protein
MLDIYLGAALFVLPHLFIIAFPDARKDIKRRIGDNAHKGLHSLLVAGGLALLVKAYLTPALDEQWLYQPWIEGRTYYLVMVFIACVLWAAMYGKGHLRLAVRHPMSIGTLLWGSAHLMANGELPLVWLFGSITVVSLADIVFSFARGKRPQYEPAWSADGLAILAGTVIYLLFLFGFHPYVLGVPVL